MDVGGTYSQIGMTNRLVGLPLCEAPLWGFQKEAGILLSSFLVDGFVEFQEQIFG